MLNILLQLNHHSILKFIGYDITSNGKPSIITEFAKNGSLGRILNINKTKSQLSNDIEK